MLPAASEYFFYFIKFHNALTAFEIRYFYLLISLSGRVGFLVFDSRSTFYILKFIFNVADTIADTKERVRVLQEKVDEHKLVKEKERSLQDSLREVEDGIAKCALDCGALQSEVEQNNVQIQTLKDDIALLQKQAQGKEVDEEEMRKVQELDEALNEKKQHLEINMQKIEEKVFLNLPWI